MFMTDCYSCHEIEDIQLNFILIYQENVEDEGACQTICHDTQTCQFYTWFDETNKVFHNYCFLFSSCEKVKK